MSSSALERIGCVPNAPDTIQRARQCLNPQARSSCHLSTTRGVAQRHWKSRPPPFPTNQRPEMSLRRPMGRSQCHAHRRGQGLEGGEASVMGSVVPERVTGEEPLAHHYQYHHHHTVPLNLPPVLPRPDTRWESEIRGGNCLTIDSQQEAFHPPTPVTSTPHTPYTPETLTPTHSPPQKSSKSTNPLRGLQLFTAVQMQEIIQMCR